MRVAGIGFVPLRELGDFGERRVRDLHRQQPEKWLLGLVVVLSTLPDKVECGEGIGVVAICRSRVVRVVVI